MSDFNYFKADRVYNELYYQFPKVFLVSEEYRKMSDSTKIAYMLLKARLQAAIVKNQIDEEGNVYFTYTTKELCRVLNCQKQKAISIKDKLEEFGLLLQKDMGFNKKLGKQNPNRMYLAELNVTENDIYMLEKIDSDNRRNDEDQLGMNIIPSQQNSNEPQSLDAQKGMKIIPSQNVDKSEGMKIKQVLNNSSLQETKGTKRNYKTPIQQKDLLLEDFAENMIALNQTFLPYAALLCIEQYSHTFEEAHELMKAIHNAKANAEKKLHDKLNFESLIIYDRYESLKAEDKVTRTVKSVFMAQKTQEVRSLKGLMFTWATNCFLELIGDRNNLDRAIAEQEQSQDITQP